MGGLPTLCGSPVTSPLAKKVVSDSLGVVDFSIGLVNSVLNDFCS